MRRPRNPKVIQCRLPPGVLGQGDVGGNVVEIDPTKHRNEYSYLNTLVHEFLHNLQPDMPEYQVRRVAGYIARGLWRAKYRRIR